MPATKTFMPYGTQEKLATRPSRLRTLSRLTGTAAGLDGDDIIILARKDNSKPLASNHQQNQRAQLPKEIWACGSLLDNQKAP
jgi:hypothetical protein